MALKYENIISYFLNKIRIVDKIFNKYNQKVHEASKMICKSFAPIIDHNCRILILGSMPGVKSLTEQQYYAHPYNRFWRLMCLLLDEDIPLNDYAAKTDMLLKNDIALWDTLAYCEREGSLDSDINGEIPNDIVGLLNDYPRLITIVCNGGKASSAFRKYFAKQISQDIKVYYLHSTSPANARMTLDALADEWKIAFE